MSKLLFQTVQFSISTQFSSIWPIDETLPGYSGPGSNSNKRVLHIPQSSCITGTSSSDCLVSYPGQMQSMYSTAPANWVTHKWDPNCYYYSGSEWIWE